MVGSLMGSRDDRGWGLVMAGVSSILGRLSISSVFTNRLRCIASRVLLWWGDLVSFTKIV